MICPPPLRLFLSLFRFTWRHQSAGIRWPRLTNRRSHHRCKFGQLATAHQSGALRQLHPGLQTVAAGWWDWAANRFPETTGAWQYSMWTREQPENSKKRWRTGARNTTMHSFCILVVAIRYYSLLSLSQWSLWLLWCCWWLCHMCYC